MLYTNYPKDITASCENCDKLSYCTHKERVEDKLTSWCDLAKEGCSRYEGEGQQTRGIPTREFIKFMKENVLTREIARSVFACSRGKYELGVEKARKNYIIIEKDDGYIISGKREKIKRKFKTTKKYEKKIKKPKKQLS
jgi:hypothetical protein